MFCCACEGTCCHTGPHTFCADHSGTPTPPMMVASPPPMTLWPIYITPGQLDSYTTEALEAELARRRGQSGDAVEGSD